MPSSLGWGSAVLATRATLAPSAATRLAIASPMPRLAPEMNMVFPDERHGFTLEPSRRQDVGGHRLGETDEIGGRQRHLAGRAYPRCTARGPRRAPSRRRRSAAPCAGPAARCRRRRSRWTARRRRARPSRPSVRRVRRRRPSSDSLYGDGQHRDGERPLGSRDHQRLEDLIGGHARRAAASAATASSPKDVVARIVVVASAPRAGRRPPRARRSPGLLRGPSASR